MEYCKENCEISHKSTLYRVYGFNFEHNKASLALPTLSYVDVIRASLLRKLGLFLCSWHETVDNMLEKNPYFTLLGKLCTIKLK